MSRRKFEDEHIRGLNKGSGGSSYSIILPSYLVRELGWQSKQKLEVKKHGEGILITDWEEK